LGIDLGTSGCKAVITDFEGRIIGKYSSENEIVSPRPGWFEQDPEKHWWKSLVGAIKALLKELRINPRDISGIGLTGMYMCAVILDENGEVVRPAILHYDTRKNEILRQNLGRSEFAGRQPQQLANLLWLKENEPEAFKNTKKVLGCHNYLVYRLTGHYGIDYSVALSYGFFDISRKRWDEEAIVDLGISTDLLPSVYPAYAVIGGVTEDAADSTGLEAGTPVIVGSGDSEMSVISAGKISRGDAIIKYGSISSFVICLDEKGASPSSILHCAEPPVKMQWISRNTPDRAPRPFGALIKWFRDEFCDPEKEIEKRTGTSAYEILDREAEGVPSGAGGLIVLPYFFDSRGRIHGLNLSHTRVYLYRALLENCGYGLRYDLELFKRQAESGDITLRRVIAMEGGAKSRLWRQIVSDILNLPQEYVDNPGSCYGAAYLAGYGVGAFKDFNSLRDNWVKVAEVTYPKPENRRIYDELFKAYEMLEESERASRP